VGALCVGVCYIDFYSLLSTMTQQEELKFPNVIHIYSHVEVVLTFSIFR